MSLFLRCGKELSTCNCWLRSRGQHTLIDVPGLIHFVSFADQRPSPRVPPLTSPCFPTGTLKTTLKREGFSSISGKSTRTVKSRWSSVPLLQYVSGCSRCPRCPLGPALGSVVYNTNSAPETSNVGSSYSDNPVFARFISGADLR
jgi:hypothetical protein